MKVLHINCTDAGSTGKIICEISKYLAKEKCSSFLCTPKITMPEVAFLKKIKTSGRYEQAIYKRLTAVTGFRYAASPIATYRIIKTIKNQKPDIIHMHSANCYMANIYSILKYAAKKHIAVVITNHAEFYYTGNCAHAYECNQWIKGCHQCHSLWDAAHSKIFDMTGSAWKKMKNCLSALPNVIVVSVSPWAEKRSSKSGIMAGIPQCTILNGVDIKTFHRLENRASLKKQYHLSEKIVLFVTPIFSDRADDIKGGQYVIELARKLHSQATVIVVGKNTITNLPSNVLATGEIKEQKLLADYYNVADVVISAGKKETFGMTVAESLCCGTPVVGFEAGGPESIALREYSTFVPYGDLEALYIATQKWLNCPQKDISKQIEKCASVRYASETMAKQYVDLYRKILTEASDI